MTRTRHTCMKLLLLLTMAVTPLAANPYPQHNLTFGAGAGIPGAELTGLLNETGGVSIGYGYRLHRYFQADVGLDVMFGAAGVREFLPTDLGFLRIKDYQYLVPLGGRVILPVARGRWLLSGGGGGVHMRYSERVRQPSSYYRVDCPTCGSRNGWGYYGLVGASYFLDRDQTFRVGVTSKVYRGHTEGEALGAIPSIRTRDRWVNIFGEFGFSF